MPEFDGTATKRTCVDVSDVLINVASDRSNDIHNISDGRIIVNSYRINDYLPLTIINN